MKLKYGSVLVALVMMLVVISGGLSAKANPSNTAGGKSQTQAAAARPAMAEPNPSWHDQYPDYYKVRMASASDGWIVGAEGAIRRYAGGQWVAYASPVTTTLRSIYPISNTAFAVGDNNVIMQFSNDAWQVTPGPSGCANFRDVWMVSPSDGWAVGSSCAITPTAVLAHYNGSAWQPTTVPTNTTSLNAVQMISSTEGWAVGNAGIILHYTGGSWQNSNSGISSDIYSIAMLPDGSEGWAGFVGYNGYCYTYNNVDVIHYADGVWSSTLSGVAKHKAAPNPCVVSYEEAYGIAALSATSRWFVGAYSYIATFSATSQGAYYEGGTGGNTWDGPGSGVDDDAYPLYSVYMVAANDVWAVGFSGYIKHYDGSSWHNVAGAALNIYGLDYNPMRGELYQAGTTGEGTTNQANIGSILITNPVNASTVLSCTTPQVIWRDVASAATADMDAWTVGYSYSTGFTYNGYVAHITTNGCDVSTVATASLNSLIVVSPSLAVAVGGLGTLAVYTGTWLTTTLGTNDLNGVAYKDGRYWAVGKQGTIYTTISDPGNPANWQVVPTNGQDDLHSVSAVSGSEAWVVGTHVRYHVLGNNATREDSSHNLNKVYMVTTSTGWAVGGDGSIEHFDGSGWATPINGGPALNTLVFTSLGEGWAGGPSLQVSSACCGYGSYTQPYIEGHLLHFAPACYDYYTDVPPAYFAHSYILDLSCRGIVSGMGDHVYAPNANATRIQFAKIISLARGWTLATPSSGQTFSDVPPSNPLYAFVEAAYANHAISGADAATCQARGIAFPCFLPNDPISRAQAVVITVRAFGWPIDTTGGPHFSDVSPDNYAYGAVETAYNKGVVSGVGGGLFAPNASVTRAQIAKIVDLALTSP